MSLKIYIGGDRRAAQDPGVGGGRIGVKARDSGSGREWAEKGLSFPAVPAVARAVPVASLCDRVGPHDGPAPGYAGAR